MAEQKVTVSLMALCDLASITREGKLNVLGMFEQMYIRNFPTNYIKFSIVGVVQGKQDEQVDLELRVVNPDGEDAMPTQKVPVKIGGNGKANMIFDVINLPIPKAGMYTAELMVDGDKVGEAGFQAVKVNAPQQQVVN